MKKHPVSAKKKSIRRMRSAASESGQKKPQTQAPPPIHRRLRAHLKANAFKLRLTLGFTVIAAIVFSATILLLPDPTPRLIAITCVLGALSVVWFYVRVSYWEMQGIEVKEPRVTRAKRSSSRKARAPSRRR